MAELRSSSVMTPVSAMFRSTRAHLASAMARDSSPNRGSQYDGDGMIPTSIAVSETVSSAAGLLK